LHDGLGPHLTGVAMKADAALNLVRSDPGAAATMAEALGRDTRAAIAEVRRVIDGLSPAALDELGLVGALRGRVDEVTGVGQVHVRLDAPETLPQLPQAVEVAAYRVATEALNNVLRHAQARAVTVRLHAGDRLDVEVVDDGRSPRPWVPGVGLRAMCARATELGGSFEAGPVDTGGRVLASFPMAVS
jgi:two-component system NarL family sensor kinase